MKEELFNIIKDIIFYVVIGAVFVTAVVFFIIYVKKYKAGEDAYKKTEEIVSQAEKEESEDSMLDALRDLQKVNPELVGYLTIPETRVHYPVVKTDNNEKYLDTDFEGKKSIYGCLFMDCNCDGRFTSLITVIYGHNMRNGAMFGTLKDYRSYSYYSEHPYIIVYTFYGTKKYEIIGAYVCRDNDKIYNFLSVASTNDYEEYLKHVTDSTPYMMKKTYDLNKHTLVLSTCHGKEDRYVVVAQEI